MAFVEWTDELDVRVDAMNFEHKELIRLMNELHDINESGAAKPDILGATQKLADYTVKHFADEEAYMESIQFTNLEVHRGIHRQLLEKFNGFVTEFEDSSDQVLAKKFFDFLAFWLASHIKGIDTQYSG